MRLLLTTPEFPPREWGGLARTVSKVARHARDMGHEVHVAHFTVADRGPVLLDENRVDEPCDGFVVHHLALGREPIRERGRELWDCPHTLTLQMMYQSLEMLFREFTFDLAHSFFLYPVGYVTGLIAKRTGAPHITTIVGNDVKRYIFSPEKVAVCRSGLENADRVAALSVDLMEMADALSPCREKTRIIYNSVEIPTVLPKPVSRPLVIGCAGIFKYAKGLPYLFKAVERVREAHDVRLRIAGRVRPDEKPVVQAMLDRTGIADIVEFSGTVPHDAMSEWLSGLDVFTLPSLTEGCPNALMEAMAVGLPCVATDTGACSSLIEHGISGLIVPWANSEALAEAVSRVCADRDFAAGLGVAARSRAQRFSPARERACWGAIYKELVAF